MSKKHAPLESLRKRISLLDKKIVQLLDERAQQAQRIGKYKIEHNLPFHDPQREEAVVDAICAYNKGPLDDDHVRAIFTEIMSACLSLQKKHTVMYLGPEATNTHMAARKYFGKSYHCVPVKTINDVFTAVEKGEADFGVVPIENSTEGIVNYTLDLFMDSDVKIYAELYLDIRHYLLSNTEQLNQLEVVYSHPQVFPQCRNWLESHLPNVPVVEVESTAVAAQKACDKPHAAAIASHAAAELYGLNVIAERIEDLSNNTTRFLVISRDMSPRTKHTKTSILFSIKDKVGALYDMLKPFREAQLNLTKIESRPTKKKAWEYIFFVDFVGHKDDPRVKAALQKLEKQCLFMKILGSYPTGR